MKIENARNLIEEMKEYVKAYDEYEPKNMKQKAVKLYAELNNVSAVANTLNEEGYRKEGKLVAGKRAQVKLKSNDITNILVSDPEDDDKLHSMVISTLNKNRRRKGIVT